MAVESSERNPYVGPRPFEPRDRNLFFGRDREAGELLSLIIAHCLLLLYAQSGAGKTSLLNARLIPLLEEEGFEVFPLARVRGLIPEDIEPDDIPNLYIFNTLMSWTEDEADPRRLTQMPLTGFLTERDHPLDEEGLPSPRIVVFDQFEELFSFYPERWRDREEFFEQVRDALEEDPLLRVVFVIREDYVAQLDPFAPLLPEKLRTRFRMERLRKGAALAAVKGPLRDTERSFAEGVAEQLVEDLLKVRVETATGDTAEATGEFVEPVQLQVVCQSLWQGLPSDITVISQDQLQAFGDVNQALSGFYERSIKRATRETSVKESKLRKWFEESLITPVGTRGTVYRGAEETSGIPNSAVDVLEDLHLIRPERRAGARWYELTHDRFISPIKHSNEAWRAVRRRRRLSIGRSVAAALIIILPLMGIVALRTPIGAQMRMQALKTAANRLIELEPGNAEHYFQRAYATDKLGDYHQAVADFTKAIELLGPDHALAYNNRGAAYYKLGKYQQAIADFTRAIELEPDDATSWNNRGAVYRQLGSYEQAIADFTRAIELDPDLARVWSHRGSAYRELGDYHQAIADFTRALELDPDLARAYGGRGWTYSQLKDYTLAFQDFEKSIELNPDDPWLYYYRGLAYANLENRETAIADLEMALQLDEPPLDEDALDTARATLERLRGQ